MANKRSRKRVLECDLVANDREVSDFLAAFGRQPPKPPAPPRAPAANKPQIRNLAEQVWLRQVRADERENRRRERAGLPPLVSQKTWREICDG